MRSGEAPSDRRPLRLGTLRLQNRFHEPCALNRLPNGPPEIPRYVSRGDFIGNSPCYVSRGDFIGGAVNRCRPDRPDQGPRYASRGSFIGTWTVNRRSDSRDRRGRWAVSRRERMILSALETFVTVVIRSAPPSLPVQIPIARCERHPVTS
jgi:hypothetical protein